MKRFLAVAALVLSGTVLAQPISIDEFTTAQAAEGEISAPEAIGDVRFLITDVSAQTASIFGGSLIVTETNTGGNSDSVVYDGQIDGMVNSDNLGGIDLTANGNDRIQFTVTALTGTATVAIAFNNCFVTTAVDGTGTFEVLFDQGGSGGNDCSAQAASLTSLRLAFLFVANGDTITLDSLSAIPGSSAPAPVPSPTVVPTLSPVAMLILFLMIAIFAGLSRSWLRG